LDILDYVGRIEYKIYPCIKLLDFTQRLNLFCPAIIPTHIIFGPLPMGRHADLQIKIANVPLELIAFHSPSIFPDFFFLEQSSVQHAILDNFQYHIKFDSEIRVRGRVLIRFI
jgi:hypothetical protein